MRNTTDSYTFHRVWQSIDQVLADEIIAFWLENGALHSREAAADRLSQVAFIARSLDGAIVGVTTSYLQLNEHLNNHFYYVRVFVAEPARKAEVGIQLLQKLERYFESLFLEGMLKPAIGLCLEVENRTLKEHQNKAVWPGRFVFVGLNSQGHHVRVFYFSNARIS